MLCVRKVLVEKKFFDKRGREYQDVVWKKFCLTVPKNLVGEPFGVSLIAVSKIFMLMLVRHDFSSIFFVSQNRKALQGNPSVVCFKKLPVTKKFMDKRGEGSIKILRRKKFVSQCRKNS